MFSLANNHLKQRMILFLLEWVVFYHNSAAFPLSQSTMVYGSPERTQQIFSESLLKFLRYLNSYPTRSWNLTSALGNGWPLSEVNDTAVQWAEENSHTRSYTHFQKHKLNSCFPTETADCLLLILNCFFVCCFQPNGDVISFGKVKTNAWLS